MISAQNIHFTHPGADYEALRDVSLKVPAGQICCVLGVNGSGKSTLLSLLAGVCEVSAGSLTIAGASLPAEAEAIKGQVALVPQDPDLYILGSLVEEDLLLALDPKDTEAKKQALHLAELFGLSHLLKQPVHTISYGQKRKLCIASALASNPKLLLLDEPFAGLDYPAALVMREALSSNKQNGITQVIVGHDLDLMADLAELFVVLDKGKMVGAGSANDVYPQLLQQGVRPPCWWFKGENTPIWQQNK